MSFFAKALHSRCDSNHIVEHSPFAPSSFAHSQFSCETYAAMSTWVSNVITCSSCAEKPQDGTMHNVNA